MQTGLSTRKYKSNQWLNSRANAIWRQIEQNLLVLHTRSSQRSWLKRLSRRGPKRGSILQLSSFISRNNSSRHRCDLIFSNRLKITTSLSKELSIWTQRPWMNNELKWADAQQTTFKGPTNWKTRLRQQLNQNPTMKHIWSLGLNAKPKANSSKS